MSLVEPLLNTSSSDSSDGEVKFDKMSKEILENQLSQLRSELEAERKKSQQLKENAELYKRVKREMETELSACLDEQATRHHERMKEMVQEFKTGCNIADKVKVNTLIFKGKTGEDPSVHILRVKDWPKAIDSESETKCTNNFYLTLDGDAHQWIDDIGQPTSWESLKTDFCKRFSIQGRSSRHLHHKWRTLSFDPHKDDIDAFVKDVKATAKQLNYEDEAILNTIKTCMPNDIYGAIFDIKELSKLITMVKKFYAARPQVSQSAGHQAPTANTFPALPGQLQALQGLKLQALSQGLAAPREFYAYHQGDRQPQRGGQPYKPFLTRGRGRPSFSSHFNGNRRGNDNYSYRGQRGGFRGNNRGRGQKFDKSPATKKSKVNSKTPNKDFKDRCYMCHEYGHISTNCPQNPRARHRNNGGNTQYNQATCQNMPQLNFQQGMQPCAQISQDSLGLSNAYSEVYEELEQFESIDTLNYMGKIVNDHTPPEIVDNLNN